MSSHILFVTSNPHKINEARAILGPMGVEVDSVTAKIEELQSEDMEKLVRKKALEAFSLVGRPVFVEHTGLYLSHLKGLPGGLTQLFWDTLEADRFCELFGSTEDNSVTARTVIGYIDGRRIHFFNGEASGRVAPKPQGSRDFQWDCIFIPDGHRITYAELEEGKNEISMRRLAFQAFAAYLEELT